MTALNTGGRRLRVEAIKNRNLAINDGRSVSRKELASVARDAARALKLRPTLRLVLDALIGVWGETELNGKILVWPSNDYIVSRTGLSERAVRYGLSGLIQSGLITPKDSANGKRFAVKDCAGTVIDAYGFDLTAVYAQRGTWEMHLREQRAQDQVRERRFDLITICRRAIEEALTALATRFPHIPLAAHQQALDDLAGRTPRRSFRGDIRTLVEEYEGLRKAIEETFYQAANAGKSCRHKETNNDTPSDTCNKSFRTEAGIDRSNEQSHASAAGLPHSGKNADVPIALVVEACPALSIHDRPIRDVVDLVGAARYLRGALGASESAWREAVEDVGAITAAIIVAYVLQLHDDDVASGQHRIKNPGGYFRKIIRLVSAGRIDLNVEFMRLRRRHMT